jgi:hypothetical protein
VTNWLGSQFLKLLSGSLDDSIGKDRHIWFVMQTARVIRVRQRMVIGRI